MSYLPRTLPRTNLHTWLDATGLVNNTTNAYGICSGGTCSQWSDLSGNGRHFVQATGANQPTLGTGLSSRVSLDFDGGDYMNNTTDADWVFLHSTSFTIYILVKPGIIANPNAIYSILGSSAGSSSNVGLLLRYADRAASSESDAIEMYVFQGGGVAAVNTTALFNNVITPNVYSLLVIRSNAAAGSGNSMFNFITASWGGLSVASANAPSGANATYDMQVGAGGNNFTPLVGGIQELAIYNTFHQIGTLSKAAAYFQAKYALS